MFNKDSFKNVHFQDNQTPQFNLEDNHFFKVNQTDSKIIEENSKQKNSMNFSLTDTQKIGGSMEEINDRENSSLGREILSQVNQSNSNSDTINTQNQSKNLNSTTNTQMAPANKTLETEE